MLCRWIRQKKNSLSFWDNLLLFSILLYKNVSCFNKEIMVFLSERTNFCCQLKLLWCLLCSKLLIMLIPHCWLTIRRSSGASILIFLNLFSYFYYGASRKLFKMGFNF
uniref:Uncharacterized protein n=1 Tax=Cacopsylla melanoneura TaxID=428564 RepID=A0A8D8RZ49_9HEMI